MYEKASDAKKSIRIIMFFTRIELAKVQRILKRLTLSDDPSIVLIDARADNKPSGSQA